MSCLNPTQLTSFVRQALRYRNTPTIHKVGKLEASNSHWFMVNVKSLPIPDQSLVLLPGNDSLLLLLALPSGICFCLPCNASLLCKKWLGLACSHSRVRCLFPFLFFNISDRHYSDFSNFSINILKFQDSTQNTALHLVIMSLESSLTCDHFAVFLIFHNLDLKKKKLC